MLGSTVSHYRIEERIGEGGMGVVYRAHDLTLNRAVAVKFLSLMAADGDRRRRFQFEAEAARASWEKRRMRSGWRPNSGRRTLMATARPSVVSSAR